MPIRLKRAYEPPAASDGYRALVDRVWPRGIGKEALKLDGWLKDLAPSVELRRWFGHDPEKWQEFRERYFRELDAVGAETVGEPQGEGLRHGCSLDTEPVDGAEGQLRPDLAPKHVARIKELAREGFYDGIIFHRVIPGFMAQTGDPTGTGRGGSDKPDLPAEFSNEPFVRGTVGMARTSDPNSANSQFFIMFAPAPHLNGQYTDWGQVTDGMQFVDQIAKGEPPAHPDKIVKMQVAADAK